MREHLQHLPLTVIRSVTGPSWSVPRLRDVIYFLKGMTKSLLLVGVGGVLVRLITMLPWLALSKIWPGRNLLGPNFFTPSFKLIGSPNLSNHKR